jgi:predicted DNA-binding protein (MmcQ/YjbR family)/CheY-like chemotaxis protein
MMDPLKTAEKLRKIALGYPETYEESPWGDRVVKVKGKIFLFCGSHDGQLYLSVKLPSSGREVLKEPWAKPTPYGLGKSGWVSAQFKKTDKVPEDRIAQWIDESYRALAPKKLIAQLGEAAPATKKKAPLAKTPKLKHRVILLCEDKLRIERAQKVLAEHGITVDAVDSAAAVKKKLATLDAAILDVGRSQDEGLALAAEIDASDHPIHLFIAGIRDARAHKKAEQVATSAERFREPPGDPAVAAAIATTLAAHKPRKR